MAKRLLTLHIRAENATVRMVCRLLDIDESALDSKFGVVALGDGTYAVLIEAAVAEAVADRSIVEGSFSNPRIASL